MSYDNPNRQKYTFQHDFSASDFYAIQGPKGKAGRLWDYGVEGVTTAVTASGSDTASVSFGTSANPDANGEEFSIAGLAVDRGKGVRQTYDEVADASSFDALMVDKEIAADTVVGITCNASSTAGAATAFAVIDWDL